MKHVIGTDAGRGRVVTAALVLSGVLLLHAYPAQAADCGGGALSPSTGNLIGSAIGGAAGGLLGNQFGHGSGKGVMTGVGVVGGALAGGYVGRSMEGCGNAPRHAAAPGPSRAARRSAAAPARPAGEARTCRFVLTQAVIDGREQQVDGVACLEADGTWKTASGAAAEQAAEADLVLRAQQRLHEQGFYVRDNIDGRWGPATSAAVGNFQRANGLAASGRLDVPTRKALGLDPAPLVAGPADANGDAVQAGAAQQVSAPGAVSEGDAAARAEPVRQAQ
jgi:surface antigen